MRPKSAWIWSAARRTVAVEATIFGGAPVGRRPPGAQAVDRRLVETGHRAERARDEVQLVLDDEVRRVQAALASALALARVGRA